MRHPQLTIISRHVTPTTEPKVLRSDLFDGRPMANMKEFLPRNDYNEGNEGKSKRCANSGMRKAELPCLVLPVVTYRQINWTMVNTKIRKSASIAAVKTGGDGSLGRQGERQSERRGGRSDDSRFSSPATRTEARIFAPRLRGLTKFRRLMANRPRDCQMYEAFALRGAMRWRRFRWAKALNIAQH